MLIVCNTPIECDNCKKQFKPFTMQEAQYHCEKCGKLYKLCPNCAKNTKCSCGSRLSDAWHIGGRTVIY